LEGWGGHPISGLPKIGTIVRKSAIADVRSSRRAAARDSRDIGEFDGRAATLLSMRPREARGVEVSRRSRSGQLFCDRRRTGLAQQATEIGESRAQRMAMHHHIHHAVLLEIFSTLKS